MEFNARTAPPEGQTEQEMKQDEIKGLIFAAVKLYVDDNEKAKQELLGLLGVSEPEEVIGDEPDPIEESGEPGGTDMLPDDDGA